MYYYINIDGGFELRCSFITNYNCYIVKIVIMEVYKDKDHESCSMRDQSPCEKNPLYSTWRVFLNLVIYFYDNISMRDRTTYLGYQLLP